MSFHPNRTTKDEVRQIISEKAAVIANDMLSRDRSVPEMDRPFRDAHWKGQWFCIDFDDSMLEAFPEVRQAEIYRELQRIGGAAVKEAIRQNIPLIVGLMLGEARQGRSIFGPGDNGNGILG